MKGFLLRQKKWARWLIAITISVAIVLSVMTYTTMQSVPSSLGDINKKVARHQFLDRNGKVMNVTYENRWNIHDVVELHDMPLFIQQAIIASEDKRFYVHGGCDWLARLSAVKQNLFAGESVRGASTITEQVVKMLHPRPRTIWTRWLEGFEAQRLEHNISKHDILEFYLNQVPFAARRRGIKQAAAYYFDRDMDTLNKKEMMALAVMVRSPKWLNPYHYPQKLDKAINNLANRLQASGLLDNSTRLSISKQTLTTKRQTHDAHVGHFIEYVRNQPNISVSQNAGYVYTTLDMELQGKVQKVLNNKLDSLKNSHVQNGAVLVVDHHSNEVIAWAVGYAGKKNKPFNNINPVVVARQPGSALKPFLYARAMEKGWTAATMLSDTPLEEGVGSGLHSYHNYSRSHYGLISLREALGNSLNIPAVRTIQFVGTSNFLQFLHKTGIKSLLAHPSLYGDGIALGNGELTLLELTHAYTTLARMGNYKPLSVLEGQSSLTPTHQVINPDIASLLANILSDPGARAREFGTYSILNFPQQTAVKTGTSSDYRDAWAVGFNDRYTLGVWFGNLDYTSMHEVTGSTGPTIVLRTLFNELNRGRTVRALFFSPNLVKKRICIETGEVASEDCRSKDEWFLPEAIATPVMASQKTLRLRKPTNGLHIAMDPRIPDEYEVFEFEISQVDNIQKVDWYVNEDHIGTSHKPVYQWQVKKGEFSTYARIYLNDKNEPVVTQKVSYLVK